MYIVSRLSAYASLRIWRGCPAGGRFPPDECFLALGFALPLMSMSYSLQSWQHPQPNPRTLDEYTPHQYWSANFVSRLELDKCSILVYCSVVPSKRRKMACVMRVRRTYNHGSVICSCSCSGSQSQELHHGKFTGIAMVT